MKTPNDFVVSLKVASGPRQGQAVPVTRLPFAIGKDASCQLRSSSEAIAARHCVLQPGPGGLAIADLGSATGTWVNGVRIEGAIPVGDGDELRIGPLVFTIIVEMIKTPPLALPQTKTKLEITADRETLDEMPVPIENRPPQPVAKSEAGVKR